MDKEIRHRFYRLGKKRNFSILRELGKLDDGEDLTHEEMKVILLDLDAEGRLSDLVYAIELNEEEIRKEKEDALSG